MMMRKVMTGIVVILAGPALAEPLVIAALGDSLTQGYGLPAEDGLVPQLQAWLQENGADVQLINAGVSGDTTAGGLSRVAWTMTPEVDGMIVALGGNDLPQRRGERCILGRLAGPRPARKGSDF
jgi:acyl-CoA thioesterase-1